MTTIDEQQPFGDAAQEASFQAMREALRTPAREGGTGLILLVTLALFVFSQLGGEQTLLGLAVLVGVLLFHELGHLAGMKLFGYRDVKMFFIPFFGAAVSGRRRDVAGWKEGLVLLAGPLPGIAIGVWVASGLPNSPSPALHTLATALLLINAFNLLPVAPLDGGRFFHLLLFCRHRWLEIGYAALAALLLIASFLAGFYLLPILGVLALLGLPRQWRARRAAEALQRQFADWRGEPAQLPEPQLRAAFLAVRSLVGEAAALPRVMANAVEGLVERATLRPPSVIASLLLVLLWAAGLVGALVGSSALSMSGPVNWQTRTVPEGGFSVLMPREVAPLELQRDTPLGPMTMHSLDTGAGGGLFTARWYDIPAGRVPDSDAARAEFLDRSRDKLLARAQATLVREEALPDGRSLRLREPDGHETLAQIHLVGPRVYLLFAPVEPADETRRFFDSFRLEPSRP